MFTEKLSIWDIYQSFWCKCEKTVINMEMIWHNNRFYRKMWELREDSNSGLRIEYEIFGVSEEIELCIIIFREITVPVEMIRMEIGENTILSIESTDMVCHKARYLEYYMSFFFSFLMYFWEEIRESRSEITTQIDGCLWKTSPEEMEQEPRCRRFTISTSDSMYLESFWDIFWEEIQLRNNLVRLVYPMRRRKPRRWDKMRKTLKRFRSIGFITEDKIESHFCTKSCERLPNFSLTEYEYLRHSWWHYRNFISPVFWIWEKISFLANK